jgi:phosphoglycerate dehydrogenase-like enzyme
MLADMCAALGMTVIYAARSKKSAPYEHVTLDELFARSDCIALTCPLTAETKAMINGEAIAKMKEDMIVVNICE